MNITLIVFAAITQNKFYLLHAVVKNLLFFCLITENTDSVEAGN